MSKATICCILKEDAIAPWCHHPWIYPRDPEFRQKAEIVLDLYQGTWHHRPLGEDDYVVCYDEKPGIQCLRRLHPSSMPGTSRPVRVEHEYQRLGTIQYMATWDVFRGKIYGDCVMSVTKPVFHGFVGKVMGQKIY